MCKGQVSPHTPFLLHHDHTIAPLSPKSELSSSTHSDKTKVSPTILSSVPRIVFIPAHWRSQSPRPARGRHKRSPRSVGTHSQSDDLKALIAGLPRLPLRQESMEDEPGCPKPVDDSSPSLPQRTTSTSSFDQWLAASSHPRKKSVLPIAADCHHGHIPATRRSLPHHFQHISDPDAGGNRPRLPQRRSSFEKLP